jgi:probable addiction module antidote protein
VDEKLRSARRLKRSEIGCYPSSSPPRSLKTSQVYDVADYLESEEALGDIARARGMAQLAKDTGISREGLYKALSPDGNPSLTTVLKVVKALGLKLTTKVA